MFPGQEIACGCIILVVFFSSSALIGFGLLTLFIKTDINITVLLDFNVSLNV